MSVWPRLTQAKVIKSQLDWGVTPDDLLTVSQILWIRYLLENKVLVRHGCRLHAPLRQNDFRSNGVRLTHLLKRLSLFLIQADFVVTALAHLIPFKIKLTRYYATKQIDKINLTD
ncbi:MAG: hypothetical protein AAGD25_33835 [Cyanobacteria bacterium P01_F01_bin.150]